MRALECTQECIQTNRSLDEDKISNWAQEVSHSFWGELEEQCDDCHARNVYRFIIDVVHRRKAHLEDGHVCAFMCAYVGIIHRLVIHLSCL